MRKTLAVEVVVVPGLSEENAQVEIEPTGHFLTGTFSAAVIPMANYETGFYDATLSDSDNFEQWEEKGSKDAATRAYDR